MDFDASVVCDTEYRTSLMHKLARLRAAIATAAVEQPFIQVSGVVREVASTHYRVRGLSSVVKLGDRVSIEAGERRSIGEVVRVDEAGTTIKPFDNRFSVGIGMVASLIGAMRLRPAPDWKGRVVNALGESIDGLGPLAPGDQSMPIDAAPPSAMLRQRVERPLMTGVRVIDLFTPFCQGQRIGIFAGSGVGKSTLLSMLARSSGFDTVVVALVGERGREVREFLEGPLAENRKRAVTIVSTGDESPMMRRLALSSAMCVAEYFRDRGESVLLIVDSVTRYAHSARDVALAAGEPAVARGYAPSVFSDLPKILERAGPGAIGTGSITGVFAVLPAISAQARPSAEPAPASGPRLESFADLVAYAAERRELKLKHALEHMIRPIRFELGQIEISLTDDAPSGLANALSSKLEEWTGRRWMVAVGREGGAPTIAEARRTAQAQLMSDARADPVVAAVLSRFPGAEIVDVRVSGPASETAPVDPPPIGLDFLENGDPVDDD